ncbi:MAG TPA: stalk domain-containing protein [Syntrophomonadaceae bacterium]|nr:stalk domain-containing protein [Syntrophomonadaceae bacterium]
MKRQLSIKATMVIVVIAILFVNTLTGVSTVASGAVGHSRAGIPTYVLYYFVETNSGNSGHLDSVYKRATYLVNVDSISANDGIEAWKVSHFSNGQAVFEIHSADGKRSQTMKYAAHNDKTADFTGPNYWDASGKEFIVYHDVRSSPSANFDYGYHGNCLDRDAVPISNDPFFKNNTGHSLELYYLDEEQYNELSRQLDMVAQAAVPKVIYNGQPLSFDTPPMIKDDRLLVPISPIATAMGAKVDWDPSTQTVNLTLGNTSVRLIIGDTTAYINDQPKQLDVPAQIIGERTLVPLGFISTGLGATVSWDGATQTASITYTPSITLKQTPSLSAPSDPELNALGPLKIDVRWKAVPGALEYHLYRCRQGDENKPPSEKWTYMRITRETSIIDEYQLTPQTGYYYAVAAVNDMKQEGTWSNSCRIVTQAEPNANSNLELKKSSLLKMDKVLYDKDRHPLIYAYNDEFIIDSLVAKPQAGGWLVSMNVFNQGYADGVLEVLEPNGEIKMGNFRLINGNRTPTNAVVAAKKDIEDTMNMLTDEYGGLDVRGDASPSTTKTPIESIFVPAGGSIRITKNPNTSATVVAINVATLGLQIVDEVPEAKTESIGISELAMKIRARQDFNKINQTFIAYLQNPNFDYNRIHDLIVNIFLDSYIEGISEHLSEKVESGGFLKKVTPLKWFSLGYSGMNVSGQIIDLVHERSHDSTIIIDS